MLEKAIRQEGWASRLEQGRALVAAMFERDLFGLTEEVPTDLKMRHMATLFSRFSQYRKADLAPAMERLREFEILRTTAEDHVGALMRERDEAKLRIDAVIRQRDEVKLTLDAILASTSWKVTAPVRRLVDWTFRNRAGAK
jgi:hypothetical protein